MKLLLTVLLAAAVPLSAQSTADSVLKLARDAAGVKLSLVHTLSAWGAHRRGPTAGQFEISLDLAGTFRVEHSSLSTGGQIQRSGGDGSAASGGMPGDDGGPAMALGLSEGISGGDYWVHNGAGAGKHSITASYVRYTLALLLAAPQNLPVSFTFGGRLESDHRAVDAVEGRGPDGFLVHLYFDAKTHLPVTLVYHEDGQEVQMWLRDHRPENGILFPHLIAWMVDGDVVEQFQIQHFKINPRLRVEKLRK